MTNAYHIFTFMLGIPYYLFGDNSTSTDYLNPVGYTDVTDTSDSQITWMATVAIKYNGSDQDVFNYFTNPTISQSMFG